MRRSRKPYSLVQLASALLMIAALLWLTVSLPFVYESQQMLSHVDNHASPLTSNEEEAANPFGNSTEEKAPSGSSFSEEYLHDHHKADYFFSIASQFQIGENDGTYIAFHGELLVPPPNKA
jgi:hypothetical protein